MYSRISNPTVAVLEERIAALEGGVGAIATRERTGGAAPGHRDAAAARVSISSRRGRSMAARTISSITRCRGSASTTTFVDPRDHRCAGARRSGPNTRLLFGETLGNPGLEVLDIPRVAALAHDIRPAAAGRLDVHDALAHASVRPRRRPRLPFGDQVPVGARRGRSAACWSIPAGSTGMARGARQVPDADRAVPMASTTWCSARSRRPRRSSLRARREGIRDFGACMAPFTAFQILQGIETLPLRMAQARRQYAHASSRSSPTHRCSSRTSAIRTCPAIPTMRSREGCCFARLRRRVLVQRSRHARAGRKLVEALNSVLPSRQRRRREIAGDPSGLDHAFPDVAPTTSPRPASPRARFACRSGSRIRTTSSRTWAARCMRREKSKLAATERIPRHAPRRQTAAKCYAYTGARRLDAGQARRSVFVHGAAHDHSVWALQSRYFAHHGCNVLAVDLPGHGRSGGAALATIEAIADWIRACSTRPAWESRARRPFDRVARHARVRGASIRIASRSLPCCRSRSTDAR